MNLQIGNAAFDRRGITLLEILVVVGIVAIIAAASVVLSVSSLNQSRISTERDQLIADLRTAQSRSLTGYQDDVWGIYLESGQYTVFKGSSYAGRDTDYDQVHAVTSTITYSGNAEINFDFKEGTTSDTGTITLTEAGTGETRGISINENGRISES